MIKLHHLIYCVFSCTFTYNMSKYVVCSLFWKEIWKIFEHIDMWILCSTINKIRILFFRWLIFPCKCYFTKQLKIKIQQKMKSKYKFCSAVSFFMGVMLGIIPSYSNAQKYVSKLYVWIMCTSYIIKKNINLFRMIRNFFCLDFDHRLHNNATSRPKITLHYCLYMLSEIMECLLLTGAVECGCWC